MRPFPSALDAFRIALPVVGATLLLACPVAAQNQSSARDSMPVLLDVRIADLRTGEFASATMRALRDGATVLLPAQEICALAELPCSGVPASDLDLDAVAMLLHAHVSLDWEQLTVSVVDCDELPVLRRYRRATARAALADRTHVEASPTGGFVIPSPLGLTSSVRVGYTMLAKSQSILNATHLFNVGYAAFRGSVTTQVAFLPRSHGAHLVSVTNSTWRRAWHRGPLLRQLQVGDVAASGFGVLRGVQVTNTPYESTNGIDSIQVYGIASGGREVEIFRDGALVASGSADATGRFAFWVPATYGANSFSLASYDQSGFAHSVRRSVLIEPGMLPARALRYSLAAGRCLNRMCSNEADLMLGLAPSSRVTAFLSLQARASDARRPFALRAGGQIVARVSDVLSTSVTGTRVTEAATLHFVPDANVEMVAEYRSYRSDHSTAQYANSPRAASSPVASAASLHNSSPAREVNGSASWRSPRAGRQASVTTQFTARRSAAQSSTVALVALALPLSVAYLAPFGLYSHFWSANGASRPLLSLGVEAIATAARGPAPVSRSTLRLRLETAPAAGHAFAAATLSFPLLRNIHVDARADWTGRLRPTLSFAIRQEIGDVSITSTVDFARSPAIRAVHTLDAAIVLDAARLRISAMPPRSLGTACITGIVFIDANSNGRLDAGELPVAGAYVRSGETGSISDTLGKYELLGIVPFAPTTLQLDPLTLPSASLKALHPLMRVEPVPDQFLRVDIPVVEDSAARSPVDQSTRAIPSP